MAKRMKWNGRNGLPCKTGHIAMNAHARGQQRTVSDALAAAVAAFAVG